MTLTAPRLERCMPTSPHPDSRAEPGPLTRALLDHHDHITAFVISQTRDRSAAEDIVQDISLSVLAEDAKGTDPEHVLSWLIGLARHRVVDYYRRVARTGVEQPVGELLEAVATTFAEDVPDAGEDARERRLLGRCLDRLAPTARYIVDLRYRDGLGNDEIAATLTWKINAVKVALSKARRALADCVGRAERVRGMR